MFERYTERARQVVVLAQDEARALKHNYVGGEHLLLGLIREGEGVAARVLDSFLTVDEVRAAIRRIVSEGDEAQTGQLPFTPRAKRVVENSLREALSLGHNYVGTEHLLLALLREEDGVATRIVGERREEIRGQVIQIFGSAIAQAPKTTPTEATVHEPSWCETILRLRAGQDAPVGYEIKRLIGHTQTPVGTGTNVEDVYVVAARRIASAPR